GDRRRVPGGRRGPDRRPAGDPRGSWGGSPWGGGDLSPSPCRVQRVVRYHPQGGLPVQGPAREGRAVEGVRQPIGADEIRGPADGVGVPDAAQPAVEGAV